MSVHQKDPSQGLRLASGYLFRSLKRPDIVDTGTTVRYAQPHWRACRHSSLQVFSVASCMSCDTPKCAEIVIPGPPTCTPADVSRPGCAVSPAGVRLLQRQQLCPHQRSVHAVPAALRRRPRCHFKRPAASVSASKAPAATVSASVGRGALPAPERLAAGVFSLWRGLLQWWGESCRRAAEVTRQAETQQVCSSRQTTIERSLSASLPNGCH